MTTFPSKIRHTLEMVKFSHSIFALPFALVSLLVATEGAPSPKLLILIVLAMVFARNTAMGFNRLADASIDAANPRTQSRQIPSGLLSKKFVLLFCLMNALLFVGLSSFFNPLTLALSPFTLIFLCGYSYTKRFTSLAQIYLGACLGLAPVAAWIAATGTLAPFPIFLGLAVLFWVAGFDIIYATQDYDFDKRTGLRSLVVSLGISKALSLSRFFHAFTVGILFFLGIKNSWGGIYFGTVLGVLALFIYEHALLRKDDLSKVNAAFFTVNGGIGILYLGGVILELTFR